MIRQSKDSITNTREALLQIHFFLTHREKTVMFWGTEFAQFQGPRGGSGADEGLPQCDLQGGHSWRRVRDHIHSY